MAKKQMVQVVVILFQGIIEHTKVFKKEKDARLFILATTGHQGEDYLAVCDNEMRMQEYEEVNYDSDTEIHWYENEIE